MAGGLLPRRAVAEEHHRGEALPMIRLKLIVEGQTEELFVNELLLADLTPRGIFAAAWPVMTTKPGSHPSKGGGNNYSHWRKDIQRALRSDNNRNAYVTTMIDLYRLPA